MIGIHVLALVLFNFNLVAFYLTLHVLIELVEVTVFYILEKLLDHFGVIEIHVFEVVSFEFNLVALNRSLQSMLELD